MKYYYRIYGLMIKSDRDLMLKQFSPVSSVDITINSANISRQVVEETLKNSHPSASNSYQSFLTITIFDKLHIYIENIAGSFYICNGSEITYFIKQNINTHELLSFITCNCLAYIVWQRGWTALHGSLVEKNNSALLISGHSGAGKSTLTSQFLKKNYGFLSDDVAVIKDSTNPIVYSGIPKQKLCLDSISHKKEYELVNEHKVSVDRSDCFKEGFQPLQAIICIKKEDQCGVTIEQLYGQEKLHTFLNHCLYFIKLTNYYGLKPDDFKNYLQIVQKVPLFLIKRPCHGDTTSEQIDLIEKELQRAL